MPENKLSFADKKLPDSFHMMDLQLKWLLDKPTTFRGWLKFVWLIFWGYDIFIQGKIPFMKSLVLINIVVWLLT